MAKAQHNAYIKQMHRYDALMTGRSWWGHLFMNGLWQVNQLQMAAEVLAMIPDDFAGRLLDVPVGTAVFTCDKYKQLAKAQITALDYSEKMLEMAAHRFEVEGVTNVSLVQGDVGAMPFADGEFDYLLTMSGLQAFPDKERALREMHRVLKPGGRLCGCFYVRGEHRVGDWIARHILERKGYYCPPHYTAAEAVAILRDLFGERISVHQYHAMLICSVIKDR